MDEIKQDSNGDIQTVASENPHLENVPEVNTAPNLDNELDDALTKAFAEPKNEPITKETTKKDSKEEKSSKEEPKENIKIDQKDQGDLPKPEEVENDIPKKQQGWNALKNNYKRAHNLISEREEEIKRLKAGLAEKGSLSTKEIEALRTEIKDLSKYRTMVDIQADPEFISKYDQPIEKAKGSIKEILNSMQVDKGIIDQIDFSNTKLMDQIISHVAENRDKITAKRLERKVEEIADLIDKRNETLSTQKSEYQTFMEAKKKEASLKGAEDEGKTYKHLESIAASKDKNGNDIFPFLNKIIAKDGASQPEIDQISNHNKLVDLMQQKIGQAIKLSTPEEKAELAVAAVASHYLTAQLRVAGQKIRGLEEEIKKISNISSDTEKNKVKSPSRTNSSENLDLDSALSSHFSR